MFMTYPVLEVVQMFLAVSCLQPARVVMELPNELGASWAERWGLSVVTSLLWRSAIVYALNPRRQSKYDRSCYTVSRQPWLTASEAGRVSKRQRFKRSSRSVRTRSVREGLSLQRPFRNAQVPWKTKGVSLARRECRLTSPRFHCNFWIPQRRNLWPTVVSSEKKTSSFLKHVQSCMLFGLQRANTRHDVS